MSATSSIYESAAVEEIAEKSEISPLSPATKFWVCYFVRIHSLAGLRVGERLPFPGTAGISGGTGPLGSDCVVHRDWLQL